MKKPCPRNEQELQAAYRSSAIEELNHENEELYDYLTIHTGQNITNITAVEFLYNTLEIEVSQVISVQLCHNLKAILTTDPVSIRQVLYTESFWRKC
jgi:two-component SAPR family response regulator